MSIPFFRAVTLDDLMYESLEAIRTRGTRVVARRGSNTELAGVTLELTNPRARLSRTQTKGTPISALGEFCWYLSGREDHESIKWYLPNAYRPEDIAPDGTLPGAYGPRLMGSSKHGDSEGQLERVITLLGSHGSTRQAVIQLFDEADIRSGQADVPCTCIIQFLLRDGRLHMVTYMRSNDIYKGLPHDVFCFTLMQEWVARRLGVDLGTYKHVAGSLHLYDDLAEDAARYLSEGYQSTLLPMPEMPSADPTGSLRVLLDAEAMLRAEAPDFGRIATLESSLAPFWADLLRLLRAYRHRKDRDPAAVLGVRDAMHSTIYFHFIDRLAQRAKDAAAAQPTN